MWYECRSTVANMRIFHFDNMKERILGKSGQSNRKMFPMIVFSDGLVDNTNIGSLFYLTNMGLLVPVDSFIVIMSSINPTAHTRRRIAAESYKHYLLDKKTDTIETSYR
jgi:hypothetical protein